MGRRNQEEEKVVVDFLYKDNELVNSFYSQLFLGNTTMVKKNQGRSEKVSGDVKAGIGPINGTTSAEKDTYKDMTETIIPHDYKIIQLLEELDLIPNDKIENLKPGSIVSIRGELTFRDYDCLNKLIPFMAETDFIAELNKTLAPNMKGKKKITYRSLLTQMLKLIPYGLEFELVTDNEEFATCILNENSLSIKPNDMNRAYGPKIPSIWNVVGIIDYPEKLKKKSKSQIKSSLDEITQAFSTMLLDTAMPTIKPIVIYRKIYI